MPTQFVWGAEDPYLADSMARSTAEHVKGSYRGVPLDRVGHWVPETAREQVTKLGLRTHPRPRDVDRFAEAVTAY